MKNALKPIFLSLTVVFIGILLTTVAFAEVFLGNCGENGDNMTYKLDTETGLLEIEGTGRMTNYTGSYNEFEENCSSSAPWSNDGNFLETKDHYIKKAIISAGVEYINSYAFWGCENLTEIIVEEGNTSYYSIDGVLFDKYDCLFAFPAGKSGNYTIPDNTERIGNYAFMVCKKLTGVIIPNTVKYIGGDAFWGCSALSSINIPASVIWMASNPFTVCSSLEVLTVDENNKDFCSSDNVIYSKDMKTLVACAPKGKVSIEIPDSVTEIGREAFLNCRDLSNITLPSNIFKIGSYAFERTEFYENENNWINNELYIDDCLIRADVTVSGVYKIKDGTKIIASDAFDNMSEITSVIIPDGVISIGDFAFFYCKKLSDISIPDSVKFIGDNALYETACYNDPANWDEGSVFYLGDYLFEVKNDFSGEYTIREGTKTIAPSAFSHIGNLIKITFPESLTTINDYAFQSCYNLTELSIPEGVKIIGDSAFASCKIKTLTIPSSVESIGSCAFGNNNLRTLRIEAKDVDIVSDAFVGNNIKAAWLYKDSNAHKCLKETDIILKFIEIDEETPESNFVYNEFYDGVEIIEYVGNATDLVIPSTIDNLKVVSIGEYAFANCDTLVNVTISDGIENISFGAFENCKNLTTVKLPESISYLPRYIFSGCFNLKNINLHDKLNYISSFAFDSCIGLTSVTIPKSVEYLDCGAFASCINLTEIKIANDSQFYCDVNGVVFTKDMKELIAYPCGGAETYEIPTGVEAIESYAFGYCINLTNVTIPSSVTTIYSNAFSCCENLSEFNIPDSVIRIGSRAFAGTAYSNDESNWENNGQVLYLGNNLIQTECRLSNCTIKEGTRLIAEEAFYDATKLTDITIPDSVIYVGSFAFDYTGYYMNEDNWKDGVLYIGDHLVATNENIPAKYVIREGTIAIADNTFDYCPNLRSITVEDKNVFIPQSAFYSNQLTTVWLHKRSTAEKFFDPEIYTIKYIDVDEERPEDDFGYRKNVDETITITYYIGDDTDVVIPSEIDGYKVTEIGYGAFISNNIIVNITIPEGVKTIGDSTFRYCTNLEKVILPGSLITIDIYSFSDNPKLSEIVIPENVTTIDSGAFSNCTALTSISLPKNVNRIGVNAFRGCTKLTAIEVSDDNRKYRDIDGVVFTKDGHKLISYPCGAASNYVIPDGVQRIASDAFWNCTNLESLTLPKSINYIESYIDDMFGETVTPFLGCDNLETIYLYKNSYADEFFGSEFSKSYLEDNGETPTAPSPASDFIYSINRYGNVTIDGYIGAGGDVVIPLTIEGHPVVSIGKYIDPSDIIYIPMGAGGVGYYEPVFADNDTITSVTIPHSVECIGDNAFKNCTNLTRVIIPDSVTTIGSGAFAGCSKLAEITFPASVAELGNGSVSDTAYYKNSSNWENGLLYVNDYLVAVDQNITGECKIREDTFTIANYVFSECENYISVILPESVAYIGFKAFYSSRMLDIEVDPDNMYYCDIDGVLFENSDTLVAYPRGRSNSSYSIPDNIYQISSCAFEGCDNLVRIYMPDSICYISSYAFAYCENLTNIELSDRIYTIGYYAFEGCEKLTRISIPENVWYIGNEAFTGCDNLTEIKVDSNNTEYCDIDGVLFRTSDDTFVLLKYPAGKKSAAYYLPDNVDEVESTAFHNCKNLLHVIINENIENINHYWFTGENALSTLTVLAIDSNVFWYQNYNGCSELKIIYCYKNSTFDEFLGDSKYNMIYLDENEDASPAEDFEYILNSDGSSVTITYYTGDNENVIIPTVIDEYAVTKIGGYSFGWSNITGIVIPKSVEVIEARAFSDCLNIESITFMNKNVSIASDSFYSCPNLSIIYLYKDSTADKYFSSTYYTKIYMEDGKIGDINSDKKVDIKDIVLFAQYLAAWNVEIDEKTADCNGDGNINIKDIILLAQYLALWDVTLG